MPINGSEVKHKFNKGVIMKDLKSKIILIILAVSLIGLLCGFAGCSEQEPVTTVEITYFFNKDLIYSYRAFVEYDSVKFWGASANNYEEAKENVLAKVKQYIKSSPAPKPEKVEL